MTVSETFDPDAWTPVDGFDFRDITYHRARATGAVRIAFDRPEVLNAFRPGTVDELYRALEHARTSADVGAVLLTGLAAGRPQVTLERVALNVMDFNIPDNAGNTYRDAPAHPHADAGAGACCRCRWRCRSRPRHWPVRYCCR